MYTANFRLSAYFQESRRKTSTNMIKLTNHWPANTVVSPRSSRDAAVGTFPGGEERRKMAVFTGLEDRCKT